MHKANSKFFTQRPASRFIAPHSPLGERWMIVIHNAVTAAFVLIRQRGFDLRNAGENAVTNELEGVLMNDLLNRGVVDGFNRNFFGPVTRGSEVENYNGEKISKKPDLVFHLQRENTLWDRRQDGIFTECKPVDDEHSLSANYCAVGTDRVGVERFIIGDYAGAMHEAMMIGYVRDGFRIHPDLAKSLAEPQQRHEKLGSPSIPAPVYSASIEAESLYQTRHFRRYKWKEADQPATAITLYHSWHNCE